MKNAWIVLAGLLLAGSALAEGVDCAAPVQDGYGQLLCSDARLKRLNAEVNQQYADLLASQPLDADNIRAYYRFQYPSAQASIKCGNNVICTEGVLLGLKAMLAGEHAYAGKYQPGGPADLTLPAQPLKPYKVGNTLFDPRRHRPQVNTVVLRGQLNLLENMGHFLQLQLGGGYYVLLGMLENYPPAVADSVKRLVQSRQTVLVKGALVQNHETELNMDSYTPVSLYLAR